MSVTASKTNGRAARVAVARVPEAVAQPEGAQLAAAVLAVQAQAPTLIRNAQGQVGPRTYGYVTNDAVVDAVLPLLVEQELLWRVFPTSGEDGQPALRYRMTHVPSGEYDEDVMPLKLGKDGMQELGSAITYGRRYALVTYLNLTVDQDDDGAAASQRQPATSQPAGRPQARAGGASDRPASASQRKMLRAKAGAAKLSTADLANALKRSWGDEPVEWADEAAAGRFVDRALDRLPMAAVDAVVEQIAAAGGQS